MKSKLVIASLLLAGACAANLNAQEKTNYYTPKWSDNIFVSVGGGVHAINIISIYNRLLLNIL